MGPGTGAEIGNPYRIVHIPRELLCDPDRHFRALHRAHRLFENGFLALADQQSTESPRPKALVPFNKGQLLGKFQLLEVRELARR
ncbi:MAG TPA: hypothetical protein VN851_23060, partial [Thermoanaerobaculia bacterium]|nr:hypothetical protein [Thermoanaerobaculia bacterium]